MKPNYTPLNCTVFFFAIMISSCATPFEGTKKYTDNFGHNVRWPAKSDYKNNKFWMSQCDMNDSITKAVQGDNNSLEKILNFWMYVINDNDQLARWAAIGSLNGHSLSKQILINYAKKSPSLNEHKQFQLYINEMAKIAKESNSEKIEEFDPFKTWR